MLLCRNTPEALIIYLAALRSGDALILMHENIEKTLLKNVLDQYTPDWVFHHNSISIPELYQLDQLDQEWLLLKPVTQRMSVPINKHLAILLSTSGSTGSPKMVRLSYDNLNSNANSIADYLQIQNNDRAITTMPFSYSYGLSVINSHLAQGATLVMNSASILSREIWDTFSLHQATSIAGVPYIYQMLHRLNPQKLPLSTLKTITQAGGRLSPQLIEYYSKLSEKNGWRFFVMYGQTEATARISYVPPEKLSRKIGSIGIAIPNGKLSLQDGELLYEGPNVMMGYAENRSDLSKGDDLCGRLATGDLATVDEDGYFYLQGRIARFIKIHGNRINLDDVEYHLENSLNHAVAVTGEDGLLRVYVTPNIEIETVKKNIIELFALHSSTYKIHTIKTIPVTTSGKKDYGQLT